MSPTDINKKRDLVYNYIEKKQLKNAIDRVKELVSKQHNWSIADKLVELETN